MRVALGIYTEQPSGLAVGTVDTALALAEEGVDLSLFAIEGNTLPPRAESLAERVVWLRRPALHGRVSSTALFLASRMAASARLAGALAGQRFDAVHVFSPGMASRVPAGSRLTTQAWFHPPRLLDRLRIMMPFTSHAALYPLALLTQTQAHLADLAGYRRADLVVANTEVARAAMIERGFDAVCVPPALAVGTEPIVREPSDAFRVVFCGTQLGARRKGVRYLLEALRSVRQRPLDVTLIGDPEPSFDDAVAELRASGVEIRLPGRVSREAYIDRLAHRTDLFAFPSLYEEWGYALFEALGEGVPALAFDSYPFSEILDSRSGILVPPRDSAAMAAAIDRAAAGAMPSPDQVRDSTRERFGNTSVARRLLEAWS